MTSKKSSASNRVKLVPRLSHEECADFLEDVHTGKVKVKTWADQSFTVQTKNVEPCGPWAGSYKEVNEAVDELKQEIKTVFFPPLAMATGFLKACCDAVEDTARLYKTGDFFEEVKKNSKEKKRKYLAIALRPTHKRRVNGEQFEFKK